MIGMYWDTFRRLVERNKKPWRTFRYYRSNDGFKDTISICDFTLPARATHTTTGHAASDWYRDSFVCNVGYFSGSVPLESNPSLWNDEKHKWEEYPVRGSMSALKVLRGQGCVEDSPEVRDLIDRGFYDVV